MAETISSRRWGIYVGRLIPFLRGYASVAAGILSISPAAFLPPVFWSAVTWSGGYVVAGRLLGPYWEQLANRIGAFQGLLIAVALIVAATLAGKRVTRRARRSRVDS
jgi:membrane protein DedA with SNARE-associated domain